MVGQFVVLTFVSLFPSFISIVKLSDEIENLIKCLIAKLFKNLKLNKLLEGVGSLEGAVKLIFLKRVASVK